MISMSVFEDQSGAEESNEREGEWDAESLRRADAEPARRRGGCVVASR